MAVQFHYEPTLDYQLEAIEAVCDLFAGQEVCVGEFTVAQMSAVTGQQRLLGNERGYGNLLRLLPDALLENLQRVQERNLLPRTEKLPDGAAPSVTIEMETGTGKTYVYLRTIFELNRRYGFTKFIIVVPSVAIKEGVFKSLQDMNEHFRSLYGGVPVHSFVYDSSRLELVKDFATSEQIEVMVLTVQAISKLGDEGDAAELVAAGKKKEKASNVMYRRHEKVHDARPIDLVANTRPIVIVDEPQSVAGRAESQGRKALARLRPLCILNYSATPPERNNRIYRLDALDAYERRLVKRIQVASIQVEKAHNRPYVCFLGLKRTGGRLRARVAVDVKTGLFVKRQELTLDDGDDLSAETGRPIYEGLFIGEIQERPARLELRLPGESVWLEPEQAYADTGADAIQREMIRRTIKEHLEKELTSTRHGVKVLSLFFLDKVDRYRQYDKEGNRQPGPYAKIFEEEYRRVARDPRYATLFKDVDVTTEAAEVHGGYFSIDRLVSTPFEEREMKASAGKDAAENDTYTLIMKDKQRLLDINTKLKFIFSHSALAEGWDNPNVFQICVLREMKTERGRRQSIGRGLRLCVNQDGLRVRGDINLLTVIADEDYSAFANGLQKEIEEGTGIKFGHIAEDGFAVLLETTADGTRRPMGVGRSTALWRALRAQRYVESSGKITDECRRALHTKTLLLPAEFEPEREAIEKQLKRFAGHIDVANADKGKKINVRKEVFESEEFRALWDRIKYKTTYHVEFDPDKLVHDCIERIRNELVVSKTRLITVKAALALQQSGVHAHVVAEEQGSVLNEGDIDLPDILTDLQDRTNLTRRSIARILTESERLDDFRRNPQEFIDGVATLINRVKRQALVDGIKYERIGPDEYYAQELFDSEELRGYLDRNVLQGTKRCVYEAVVYDSVGVEKEFAEQLEINEAVKVYAKLPGWFQVSTPLGTYNPDWAVLVNDQAGERLYLVVETKGSLFLDDLRSAEGAKIHCGRAHFNAVFRDEPRAKYRVAREFADVLE